MTRITFLMKYRFSISFISFQPLKLFNMLGEIISKTIRNHINYRLIIICASCLYVLACTVKNNTDKRPLTPKELIGINKQLVAKDRLVIKGYVQRQGIDMQETPTGLWYKIDKMGTGEKIKEGDMISLRYTVTLLKEQVECYSSDESGAMTFEVGKGGVESGLEQGVLLLKDKGEATFIMPPHLAHGLPGDGKCIPARAILIYNVKVLHVR